MKRKLFLLLLPFILITSCEKESVGDKCQLLKDGISTNNTDKVKTSVESFISELSSDDYSQQNLNELATSISNNCGVIADASCFDCIQTYPAQSEMWILIDSING